MTTTPTPELPQISLEVAILHRAYNQAQRNLAELRESFRTVALDIAHATEVAARIEAELKTAVAARMEAELAAARAVTA